MVKLGMVEHSVVALVVVVVVYFLGRHLVVVAALVVLIVCVPMEFHGPYCILINWK